MSENDYLLLAENFKHVVLKKDQKIKLLTKYIFTLYGLTRTASEYGDSDICEYARTIASEALDKIMEWDDTDEDTT